MTITIPQRAERFLRQIHQPNLNDERWRGWLASRWGKECREQIKTLALDMFELSSERWVTERYPHVEIMRFFAELESEMVGRGIVPDGATVNEEITEANAA